MLLNFLRNLPFAEGASLPRPLIYVAMGSQFYSPSSHVPEALSVSSRGGESQGLQDPKRASSLSLSGLTFFLFYELYLPCSTSVSEVEGFRLRALPLCHCGQIWLQTCISQLGPSGGPSPGSVCHIFCNVLEVSLLSVLLLLPGSVSCLVGTRELCLLLRSVLVICAGRALQEP